MKRVESKHILRVTESGGLFPCIRGDRFVLPDAKFQQHLHSRADAVTLFPVAGEDVPANSLVEVTSGCLGQPKTDVADPAGK